MPTLTETTIIADAAKRSLDLNHPCLPDEYYYSCLPLCVTDAVFSIGVKYESVKNVVSHYCRLTDTAKLRTDQQNLPPIEQQQSISEFLKKASNRSPVELFNNRQRTSSRNGILKADAVMLFAQVLQKYKVEYFQDMAKIISNAEFVADIKKIPGQNSGISLDYFFMLAGSDELIKPDRMILAFLKTALQREVPLAEARPLVVAACLQLKTEFSHLTPRLLDYKIWEYQRSQK